MQARRSLLLVAAAVTVLVGAVPPSHAEPDEPPRSHEAREELRNLCPLQIDVSLGATPGRRAFGDLDPGQGWVSTGMSRYACHSERVSMLLLRDVSSSEEEVELDLQLTVKSEMARRDVALAVSLVDPLGGEHCTSRRQGLTVGRDESLGKDRFIRVAVGTQRPSFRCLLSPEEYEELFGAEEPPKVRIVLAPRAADQVTAQ